MATETETIKAARDRASTMIGKAQAKLIGAAREIASEYGLPDGINGLSAGEFLGRLSFVVSLSRDLRIAGEEHLANAAIKAQFDDPPHKEALLDGAPKPDDTEPPGVNLDQDVSKLAINPMTVKALKQAGITSISEVEKYTDDALLQVRGIAPPSLGKLREAVGAFRNPASRHG